MDFLDFYYVNDRRTHRRFAVALEARLYHPGGGFSLCSTADLSLAGAAVHLVSEDTKPVSAFGCDETGKLAVTRFHVTRPFVRLVFDGSAQTRAVIQRALRSLSDRQLIQALPLRRGDRLSTRNLPLTRADGSQLICDILDMSPHGMLLRADQKPGLGERVSLGKVGGLVVRHHSDGFAIRIQGRMPPSHVVRFPALYRAQEATSAPSFDDIA